LERKNLKVEVLNELGREGEYETSPASWGAAGKGVIQKKKAYPWKNE